MLALAASNSPERFTKGGKNTFYVTHYYGSPMQVENCDGPCMHVCPRHYPPLISCVKSHILTQSPVAASTQKRDEYFLISIHNISIIFVDPYNSIQILPPSSSSKQASYEQDKSPYFF